MNREQRKLSLLEPIIWTGDLDDDCTAKWAGLMLRAELMEKNIWWWAVYDMQQNELTIDESNEYHQHFIGGTATRVKAEVVAKAYILNITQPLTAKYLINGAFKITGRGLVLAGQITEGIVSPGDIIEFKAPHQILVKKIVGIEEIRSQHSKLVTGLIIECKNEFEVDYLSKCDFKNVTAAILKSP